MMMRTSNPTLASNPFRGLQSAVQSGEVMTINGTAQKSLILLLCVALTSAFTWTTFLQTGDPASVSVWMMVGVFGGLIAAMATIFKKTWAPITAPVYALLEGLFIGGISSIFEAQFPGIVIQAVGLTFGTLATLLVAYQTGIIQVTEKFRLGVVAATGGIALFYIIAMVLGFFGVNISILYSGGFWGIAFSLFVVTIAALNLVLDFDLIEQGARSGAPKYMEWYGAFAIMVTLIWLYIEILRLLSKMRQR